MHDEYCQGHPAWGHDSLRLVVAVASASPSEAEKRQEEGQKQAAYKDIA